MPQEFQDKIYTLTLVDQDLWDDSKGNTAQKHNSANSPAAEPKKEAKKESNEVSQSLRPAQLQVLRILTVLQGKDRVNELGDDIPAMFTEKMAVCPDIPAIESGDDDDHSGDDDEDDSDEEYDEGWWNQYEGGFITTWLEISTLTCDSLSIAGSVSKTCLLYRRPPPPPKKPRRRMS